MDVHRIWTEGMRVALSAANVAGGNVEKERDRPTRENDLPICLIAVVKDTAAPDGDPRHGAPSFAHTTEVVVALQDRAANGPALRQKLYTAGELICATLLTNLAWSRSPAGEEYLEGIAGIETAYNMETDGQSVMGAVEIKLRLLHRTLWPQSAASLPDFAGVSVTVPLIDGEDEPQPGITITVPTE